MASTPDFTADKARLVGLFLECTAYGIFLVTFPLCIRALVFTRGRLRSCAEIHWFMLTVAILMGSFLTFDVMMTLALNIKAFVLFKGDGGAQAALTDHSDWMVIIKSFTLDIHILIGDLVLIYRCWIVYNQSYLVILFPALLWVGDIAMGSFVLYIQVHFNQKESLQDVLTPSHTSFLVITVAQNLITTALIILRIRRVDRLTARYSVTTMGGRRKTKLQRVMRIVIESGLLYTVATIVCLATYLADTFAYLSVTGAELPIIVIAFNLIIIRAKSQPSEKTEYTLAHNEKSALQFKCVSTDLPSTLASSGAVKSEESDIGMSCPKSGPGGSDTFCLPLAPGPGGASLAGGDSRREKRVPGGDDLESGQKL
ncbi:hypothetical protein ONZ45_g12854 [Pleurotus djamor]|nr:hypothetical protein ONZ45_g12854 [Pleurotus djamor]